MVSIVNRDRVFLNNIAVVAIVFVFLTGAFIPAVNSQMRSFISKPIGMSEKIIEGEDETIIISDNNSRDPMLMDASDSWWNVDWDYRKEIIINHTKVTDNLSDFPVLINLPSDVDLADNAQYDGGDIVFIDDGDNQLAHEIEYFNDSSGELVAWVNVSYLSSYQNTVLYIYYGNIISNNQENIEGTWDDDFIGVWHMNESSGSKCYDSTTSQLTGSIIGDVSLQQTGIVGYCYDLDTSGTSNPYINGDVSLPTTYSEWTIEGWLNLDTSNDKFGNLFSDSSGSEKYPGQLEDTYQDNNVKFGAFETDVWSTSNFPLGKTGWIYVATTSDGINTSIYWNSIKEATDYGDSRTIAGDWTIGSQYTGNSEHTDSLFDEVRFSKSARNSSWLKTCYNNIVGLESFYSVGFEEEVNRPIISNPQPAHGSTNIPISISNLSFTIHDKNGDLMDYNVVTIPNIGSDIIFGVGNGTYNVSISSVEYDTQYIWYVNITDPLGSGNWTNRTYIFTTISDKPVIINEQPSSGSQNVNINPTLNAYITDNQAETVEWRIRTNASDGKTWTTITNGTLLTGNGMISAIPMEMIKYHTKYWWSVNASDPYGSGLWTNKTYFFTTMELALNFGTFADTHFGSEAETGWAQWDYIDKLCQDIMNNTKPCDFVVHLGDLIHTRASNVHGVGLPGGHDPYKNVMKAAYLNHLNLPHFFVAGNHDMCDYRVNNADPYMLTKTIVKETETNTYPYAMMRDNILFLVVPEMSYITWTHPTIYEWIEFMTSEYKNHTTIILAHQAIEDTCRHGGGGPNGWYRGKQDRAFWSSLFRNNTQIKMWINGHNHILDWYQSNQSSGSTQPIEYFGHIIAFSQPYSQVDFGNEHEEDRMVIYSINSSGITARSWENNGVSGYWVDEYNHTFNIPTTYDTNAKDWYSYPMFLQDNETQLTDMKTLSENITLQLIGTKPMELFFDSTMAGRIGWTDEVLLSFANDESGNIERTDPGMRAHGATSITFPPKQSAGSPWEDGKSAQPYQSFPMGCISVAIQNETYNITITAKSDSGNGQITLDMSCSDWGSGTQYSTLSGSTQQVFSHVFGSTYETIYGTYTAQDNRDVWFLQGTLSFDNNTDYNVNLFSIKREHISDVTENFSVLMSDNWYNTSGPLFEDEKEEFFINPVNLADNDGIINVSTRIDGNHYGMIRLIYNAPILLSRNARYKVNSAVNGIFNLTLTEDISLYSDTFKMFPFSIENTDLFLTADDGSEERHVSNNGNVWVTCNTPTTERTVEILFEADAPSILDESPLDEALNISLIPNLRSRVRDVQVDTVEWWIKSNATNNWITLANGINSTGDFIISTLGLDMDNYNTKYWWSINTTDQSGSGLWTNKTFWFITRPESYPLIISDPVPTNMAVNIPVTLSKLEFNINDPDGDLMNYSVITNPIIGSGSGTYVTNGTYNITVSGLDYSTLYQWIINATNGKTYKNVTYKFTTMKEPGVWWNSNWQYRIKIIINHTLVTSDQHNFTVLINLTDDTLSSYSQADGDDFVFTTYAGDLINHEIESYNYSNGHLFAWVKIPYLSSTIDTEIYLYFGNQTTGNMQNITGTWDRYYKMVQHINETSGTHYDSTIYGNDGDNFGSTQDYIGIIDHGNSFDGSDDYIRVPSDGSIQFDEGSFTAEAWIYPETVPESGGARVINNRGTGSGGSNKGYQLKIDASAGSWKFKDASIDDAAGNYKTYEGTTTYSFNDWYHVAMVYEADDLLRFYVNGVLDGTLSVGSYGNISNSLPTAIGAAIAANGAEGTYSQFYDGGIDEIRLSNISRDVDWLRTCYYNQYDPVSFFDIGDVEIESTVDVIPPVISDVDIMMSDPIVTVIGWGNISCTVTDNIEVHSVYLNITYPDLHTENTSMIDVNSGQYYYNTTFTSVGDYSYFIWTNDTSDNSNISSIHTFEITEPGDITELNIYPLTQTVDIGETFTVSVYCNQTKPIKGYEFDLEYNTSLIYANSVTEGDIFDGYSTFFNDGTINNTNGYINNIYNLITGEGNVTESGILANISFTSKSEYGISNLSLHDVGITNESTYIPIVYYNGSILVAPNWDINLDHDVSILDLVLIANHFDETGPPGWIREDVNNDGDISILDLVLIANHFDETW